MNNARIGVIGLGNMGRVHARTILENKIPGLQLIAVADASPEATAIFP